MKLIIDVPDEIVKKGFEGPLTDEERMVIIRAVGNATQYKEPQGDTISRKVLIDALKTELANVPQPDTDADYYIGVKQGLKLAEAIIDNATPVELDESVIQEVLNKRCMTAVANEHLIELHGKRPQGEWITGGKDVTGQYFYDEFICNQCFVVVTDKSNFCPNCGAKMQKGGAEMYREETCENKSHCYDYEHWHCIGCNSCKKGGAE